MHETSGVLAPVVKKYLEGEELEQAEVVIMRAYLRQWVEGAFMGPDVTALRARAAAITTDAELRAWMADALNAGIDPL